MSNDNQQKSENNLELTREMSDTGFNKIADIAVKIRPVNFDDIQNKNATIGYVDQVINKLVRDLNNTFIPELNSSLIANKNHLLKLHESSAETTNNLIASSSNLSKLIEINTENHKILKEELDKLKSEFEKSKVTDDIIDEWHVPATSDMF